MLAAVASVPKENHVPARFLDAALAQPGAPTAADIAERIGVDVGTLSRWRRGSVTLSRARWLAILAVMEMPLDWKPLKGSAVKPERRGRGRPRKAKPRA